VTQGDILPRLPILSVYGEILKQFAIFYTFLHNICLSYDIFYFKQLTDIIVYRAAWGWFSNKSVLT
jgi:hypothetical protein